MKRNAEGWNIVLAGLWNRAIFTPEWVNGLLFHEPEVETLLSIMPYLPIVYRNREVAVEVSSVAIVFRPRRLDDACLLAAERMAHAVLDKLRDTPLLAIGVNFAFTEENPGPALVKQFDFADNGTIGAAGWDLQERRIVRKIRRNQSTLNLTLVFDGQTVTIEFNYHTDTNDNQTAREAISGHVLGLRDTAHELLSQVYHLDVATGDNDDE